MIKSTSVPSVEIEHLYSEEYTSGDKYREFNQKIAAVPGLEDATPLHIIFYSDETKVTQANQAFHMLYMTLGNFNRQTRQSQFGTRIVGWVPIVESSDIPLLDSENSRKEEKFKTRVRFLRFVFG